MIVGEHTVAREQISHALLPGTIVYVHPEKRYYTVRFNFKHGSYLESYILQDLSKIITSGDIKDTPHWPKMKRDLTNPEPWQNKKYRGKQFFMKGDYNA